MLIDLSPLCARLVLSSLERTLRLHGYSSQEYRCCRGLVQRLKDALHAEEAQAGPPAPPEAAGEPFPDVLGPTESAAPAVEKVADVTSRGRY